MLFLNSTYFYENCRNSILARSSQTHAHARTVTIGTALRAARRTGTAGQPGLLGTDRQWSAVLGPGAPSAHGRRLCGLWRRRYVAVTAHCSLCIFYGWINGVREIFESRFWALSYQFWVGPTPNYLYSIF